MTDLTINNGTIIINVEGADKIWALKSSLTIPLTHVVRAAKDSTLAHERFHGIKAPRTVLPGVITAGTFSKN